jgi:hypothetical protein
LVLLSLKLDDFGTKIVMKITVAHQESHEIGMRCNGIDSVSLLLRLIELNLADDKRFNKELSQLNRL